MFGPVPSLNTILLQVPEYHRLARLRIRILQPVDSGNLHRGESLREVKLFKLFLLRRPRSQDLFVPLVRWALFHLTLDRKSTRLNSSHTVISYAVFCLKKKTNKSL